MKKPTKQSKTAEPRMGATEGKKLADLLPKPRAEKHTDLETFMAGGMRALKAKFLAEEGPELMNKATIMGLNMQQVSTIVGVVRSAFAEKGITDYAVYTPQQLKDEVNKLLAKPKSARKV